MVGTTVTVAQPAWDFVFKEGSTDILVSGEIGTAVVTDKDGNFYVTGSFGGDPSGTSLTFTGKGDTVNRPNRGDLDIFVAKYDWEGNILWVSTIGGPWKDTGVDIAYDEYNDQVVVIGNVRGFDYGSGFGQVYVSDKSTNTLIDVVNDSGDDIAVVQFDASDGSFFDGWEVIGGSKNDQAGGVVVDPYNGDIYISGSFIGGPGEAYFGTDGNDIEQYLQSTVDSLFNPTQDAFVARYNELGEYIWAYQVGGIGEDKGNGIAIWPDPAGSIVAITGSYEDQFVYTDLDDTWFKESTNGGKDVFGIGYYDDGTASWYNLGGGLGEDEGTAIIYQKYGDVYITGYIGLSAKFDGIEVGADVNTTDAFIGKSIGQDWQWVSSGGGTGIDWASDITLTHDQQPVIIGTMFGKVDFDGDSAMSDGLWDVFVARYDQSTGKAIDLESGGGLNDDKGRGVASSGDQLFVTGSINSDPADFGAISVPSPGSPSAANIFVGALDGFGPFQDTGFAFDDVYLSSVAPGDYDQDGDLDILYIGEDDFGVPTTYIYRNDISSFVNIGQASLPAVSEGDVDWGDYDADGDLDLVMSGWDNSTGIYYAKIFRNDGGASFTDIFAGLTPVNASSSDWGDYDNDGNLDLLIAGFDGTNQVTNIYRNDGGDVFANINAGLEGFESAALDWGDYDGDNDLDIFISGWNGVVVKSVIYRNDGNDTFTELNPFPFTIDYGDGEWADYDNDGDLDIAITGLDGVAVIYVMRNDGNDVFTDINVAADLTGLEDGSLDWGDFDVDGDIDLLVTGFDGFNAITYIGENLGGDTFREIDLGIVGVKNGDARWADFDDDGLLDVFITGEDDVGDNNSILYKNTGAYSKNGTPSAPTNPTISKNGTLITFSWDTATDDFTPSGGLTYNLRVGSEPGKSDIMAPMALNPTNGTRYVADIGNVGSNTSWTLDLYDGAFYWAVQAIDGGFAASAFSSPQGFNVGNVTEPIGQIVELVPGNAKAGESAKIIYDARLGDGTLVGSPKVYFHSYPVLTGPGDFLSTTNIVGNWGLDDGVGEMTQVINETDLWEIDLSPTILDYYGLASATTVYKLGMVFRNADGSIIAAGGADHKFLGGEVTNFGDIYIDLDNNGSLGSDYYTLIELYDSLGGPNWIDKSNWFDPDMNTWFGVTVSNDRVTSIDLRSNNLDGKLPASIANLTALDSLILSFNLIGGGIPLEMFTLTNLKKLDLKVNELEGVIPVEIGNLTNLEFLSLRNNLLFDPIPTEIGNLTNLTVISLGNNAFSGALPASFGQLTKLFHLAINNNQFTNSLPDLSALIALERFWVWNNNFVGDIPDYFTGFSKLTSVSVENNSFGNFPDLSEVPLTALWMSGNLFSFEDVLPNFRVYSDTLVYYPQDTLGVVNTILVPQGRTYKLNLGIDQSVAGNVYKWFFNGGEVPGQTESVFTITDFQSDSGGAYYAEITNPGAPGLTLITYPTSLFIDAPVISNIIAPTNYLLGSGDIGRSVAATFRDDVGLSRMVIGYAPITKVTDNADETQYTIEPLDTIDLSTGKFGYTIPEDAFSPDGNIGIGVQFFFAAEDAAGNRDLSSPFLNYIYTISSDQSLTLAGTVTPVTDSNNPVVSDFRMFSVPVKDATISSVFQTTSPLDDETSRFFHYNGSNTIELSSLGSSLELGLGYWVIYKLIAGFGLSFSGESANVNNDNLFQMNLNSGWNQIGNPFPFPISWQLVIDFNVAKGTIPANGISGFFSYSSGGFTGEGLGNIADYQGVFIKSNEPFTIEIPLSANANNARTGANARMAKSPLDAQEWRVPIDIENEITAYRVASIGMKPDAKDGIDYYDIGPLPYMQDYLEFNSITEGGKLSQDYVKTTGGYVWNYEASTSLKQGKTKLTWDNTYFGDNDLQLVLYDITGDRIINMREVTEYNFTLNKKRPFNIYFGNHEFIKSYLKPAKISLGKAYPNPFTNEVNIPFTLPDKSIEYGVKARIYNAMGQVIKVLADEPMNFGFYTLSWDGTNVSGQELPEGIYYYKLNVSPGGGGDSKEFSGKIILRK